jgi:hypothetical protein
MGQTYLGSTLRMGSETVTDALDGGWAVLTQTAVINQNSTNAVSVTMRVPAGSQLIQIIPDVTTAFNSGTSAILTVGTAAAGTQYVTSVDARTGGRGAVTHTAAQVAAMADVGTNVNVVATVTPTGATSAGAVRVTLVYAQKL